MNQYYFGDALLTFSCISLLQSNSHWVISGIETLLLGGACASIAFGIGQLLRETGLDEGDL